jgi:hypothetical protein
MRQRCSTFHRPETPPAHDLDALVHLWKGLPKNARIQVAEQYQFQPLHAARLALMRSGLLGEIHEAQVSVAHGDHGLSLLRKFLNLGFENATIRALAFNDKAIETRDPIESCTQIWGTATDN